MQMFVLANHKEKTQLVSGEFPENEVAPGYMFERMPVLDLEKWLVIKVFNHENQRRLEAIQVLIGLEALNNLFEV